MKNGYFVGMLAGGIAGFVDGIVSLIASTIGAILELWEVTPGTLSASFLLSVFLGNTPLNILWGVIFGFAFALVYDSFPGKGVIKGIYFGLLFYFLLSNIRMGSFHAHLGDFSTLAWYAWCGIFASLAYGSVLGYLYKK